MECVFCKEWENPSSFKVVEPRWPYQDRIIRKNYSAMLIPGLGPVVPGTPYLLVIPQECSVSFLESQTNSKSSMLDLLEWLVTNEKLFPSKKALVFEHGGIEINRGCKCIDHCHLHVMNIEGKWSELPDLLEHSVKCQDVEFDETTPIPELPYLFAGHYLHGSRSIRGKLSVITECSQPQFLRYLLGELTGFRKFDYKRKLNLETMVNAYKSLC